MAGPARGSLTGPLLEARLTGPFFCLTPLTPAARDPPLCLSPSFTSFTSLRIPCVQGTVQVPFSAPPPQPFPLRFLFVSDPFY